LLYLVLLAGIIGFLAGMTGTVIDTMAGAVFVVICKSEASEKNALNKFWGYLWEKTPSDLP